MFVAAVWVIKYSLFIQIICVYNVFIITIIIIIFIVISTIVIIIIMN